MESSITSRPDVPGFRLDRLIGEGGFGQVWHAFDEDGDEVAIKILHAELVRSIDALTRFRRELSAIERLRHPNVVRAIGHGTLTDGRPYLVLEYVEGPSLREVIRERGVISPYEMLAIIEPLCNALTVAHAAGLVHRDVKASNVIVGRSAGQAGQPAGQTAGALRPVLLDFGLVKLLDQEGPGLTSSRSMLGTPSAMAPEQMHGHPVDARTDVYALGLLAFHMLTGQPAFGGAPGVVQSYMQLHGARPRPSSKVALDPAIDEPIIRALATDPGGRFPTPRAFFEALHAAIHPADGSEIDVVALYAEAPAATIKEVTGVVAGTGMLIALVAPDSVLAVAVPGQVDVAILRRALAPFATAARIAVGRSRATIQGTVVDGPALDVEGWALYPLRDGVWIDEVLREQL